MEKRQSVTPRVFKGKPSVLFFLSLFLRFFIVILCPVLLVFTFQKKLIMAGEWALDLYRFIIVGSSVVLGGSLVASLFSLLRAPFITVVVNGPEVTLIRRFSKKEISFNISDKGLSDTVTPLRKKRSFLGDSLKLENNIPSEPSETFQLKKAVIWEVSFPSAVWQELSIYLNGYARAGKEN